MKKSKIFVIFIIVLIIFSFGFYGYKSMHKKKKTKKDYRTVKVKKDDLAIIITATGVVKASTQIDIKSEIGGKVIELPYKEGDRVSKGDVIAVIDNKQQQQKYIQTDADYRNNLAAVQQSQSSLDLTRSLDTVAVEKKREELAKAELNYKKAIDELQEQKKLSQLLIAQLEASLEVAEKQLIQDRAGSRKQEIAAQLERVNQADVTMENARKEYERQRELYEQDFVALKIVDDAEKNYLLAQSQYEAAKYQYDLLLEGTREEQLAISEARVKEAQKNLSRQKTSAEVDIATKERALSLAKNDLEQSRIALKEAIAKTSELKIKEDDVIRAQTLLDKSDASRNQALDELSKTKIVSPVDGVIINRNVEIGDVVASQTMSSAAGTTLMTMADLSEIYAEANIDETDIGKVKKDLSVTITSAAYEDLKIPGFVSYIASQALQVEQIPTFKLEIKISLDKINKKDMPHGKDRYGLLFPGMSIDADIHVAKKEKVLQLPLEAIRDKDGKKYVTILKGEKSEEVEVKTGMKNNIMIEIISGVSEGDEIKIPKVDDRDGNKDKPVTAPGNRGQRRSVL